MTFFNRVSKLSVDFDRFARLFLAFWHILVTCKDSVFHESRENIDKTHLFCYNINKQRHLRHADTYTSICLTQGLLFSYNKTKGVMLNTNAKET